MTGRVLVEGPPETGVVGYAGKPKGRADFDPAWFVQAVENHGARLAWARAARCPCRPANAKTAQPDPRCPRCNGEAWLYFGPDPYEVPAAVGELDRVQSALVLEHGAAVIRGIIHGVTAQVEAYTKLGELWSGTAFLSVRAENQLGFYDRVIDLDSEATYSEVIVAEWSGGNQPQPLPPRLRYRPTAINAVHDEDGRRLTFGVHYRLTPEGELRWMRSRAPRPGLRLSVHYLHHTTWRVIEWPHALRRAQVAGKQVKGKKRTPLGEPTALPIQAVLRLEHLVEGAARG